MILVLGMILDALLGEPKWLYTRLPHPAVLMGNLVGKLDDALNNGANKRLKGVFVVGILAAVGAALGFIGQRVPGPFVEILFVTALLAQKSLIDHVQRVANGLRMSLSQGRRDVAMIVGRDVNSLDQSGVSRSAIESASENFSDGVIAPAFWFLVGGLPGLLIYKLTNTADSMIGYRNEKYEEFGWAAARIDDMLNLVPARLSALLIWLTSPNTTKLGPILSEAPRHRSPNAGWPEAAMAQSINVALSGPRSYDGVLRDFPYVNADGTHALGPSDIENAIKTLWKSWGLAIIAALIIALF